MSAFVFLAVFGFYLSGASPSIAARDGADMASAAYALAVAHPPGYPLYALLGRLWLAVLPWGNPAYRLSVLSCAAAAGAAACLFDYARQRFGARAGLMAAFVFVFSAPMWKFALIQEKYALHALLAAALLCLSQGERDSFWRRGRLSGLLIGVGLVNHQSLLLFLPGLFVLWRSESRRVGVGAGALCAAALPWLAVGLSLYGFLWVRIGSLRDALAVVFRAQYGTGTLSAQLSRPMTADGAVRLLAWSLGAWAQSLSFLFAAAALYGAASMWKTDRSRVVGLMLGALGTGSLFVVAASFDSSNWVARSVLEPAFLIPALVAAVFIAAAMSSLGRAAVPAIVLLGGGSFFARLPIPERRDDFLAHDYAQNLRRALPPGATVLVSGDTALFGLRWFELTSPRPLALDIKGAGLTDSGAWLAENKGKADVFIAGLAPGAIPAGAAAPEGVVQRIGDAHPPAPMVLRRSRSWSRNDSYARDAKLSYAFAAWSSARLSEARGAGVVETLDMTAAALDPDDYRLE